MKTERHFQTLSDSEVLELRGIESRTDMRIERSTSLLTYNLPRYN